MSYENILTERIDKIALITLNRPEKLNAMNYELASDLDEELRSIENDDDVQEGRAILKAMGYGVSVRT